MMITTQWFCRTLQNSHLSYIRVSVNWNCLLHLKPFMTWLQVAYRNCYVVTPRSSYKPLTTNLCWVLANVCFSKAFLSSVIKNIQVCLHTVHVHRVLYLTEKMKSNHDDPWRCPCFLPSSSTCQYCFALTCTFSLSCYQMSVKRII